MKKIWLLIMISCSFFALLPSVVADQDISFIAKKDDKKHNSASRPTPPKEPNYNLVSIPLVNNKKLLFTNTYNHNLSISINLLY
ncbi:hypothetical protein PVA45_07595 (plasmid) [Entomospira entomophila]|uniref:Uncharacterized protein n=1 Tax=Entomospira entomophila TaxID=2719988 RepID=A0A968GD54_9SPIO|nr:hypothetical protein [Entomospira entomophilus]NIZ41276.1 hypothetical protein [Entomospira entomophilus]WDI36196.1 hypothetical protein PVA45_07595 [Entomospira entomophilus]